MFDPSKHSIIAWLLKHNIKTENGKPFDLKTHPFWYDVLCDWSPNIVMLKAAQGGGTTLFLNKALFAIPTFGLNAAYTMPTASDVHDLVSGKFNPIVNQSPYLQSLIKDKDSVEQKRIGDHTMYFRGTWTDRAALSFSSDLNIHDEEDRSKKEVIDQYASRQQHSTYKWNWRFSNPSVPGNGVARFWEKSDKKHWFVTCEKCNEKQYLMWPESIDVARGCYQCTKCKAEISDEARRRGSWHGMKSLEKPEYSGYWFNLMMAGWVPAKEIIKLQRDKSPEYFYNFVLGLPYAGNGNQLDEEEFFQNLTSTKNTQKDPIVIGVDTGLPIWYVIGNKQGIFHQGKCDSMHDIERLMQRFPKAIVVCDQGGDLTAPRELREKYPNRVFLCYYRQDRKTMRLIEWGKGAEHGKVIADRNRVLQQLVDELRDNRIPISGTKDEWWEMWTHFGNIYREVTEDAAGNEKFVWQRSGPDHLVHAMNYWRIGMDKFWNSDGPRFAGGTNILQDLNVQQSWENLYDDRMPARLPTNDFLEGDWRDV